MRKTIVAPIIVYYFVLANVLVVVVVVVFHLVLVGVWIDSRQYGRADRFLIL